MGINVALDGPSGAGKSTIAKAVAKQLKYVYVDTGAMYRSIAYYIISNGISLDNVEQILSVLDKISIKLCYVNDAQHVMLNDEDVSDKIRTNDISMAASKISAIPAVREYLFDLQQNIAKENNIIMDGRDIGTVVLPNAQVKIYITASADERAKRRFKETQEKGENVTYEQILADIEKRDYNDMHREIAPLKQADDAVVVDTSHMDLQQSIDCITALIKDKTKGSERKQREFAPINPVERGKKLSSFMLFWFAVLRVIVRLVYHCMYNITFEGTDNIPKDGSNIFASNHRSYQDPVFITIPTRVPLTYMAKEELFHQNFAFTLLIKAFGAFPVTRGKGDTQAIDMALEKLENGRNLVIFPEGTRSMDGKLGKGKTGVALIAVIAQVPIVPVGINFEYKLKFRRRVVVRFGKPINPAEIGVVSTNPHDLKKMKTVVMEEITKLVH